MKYKSGDFVKVTRIIPTDQDELKSKNWPIFQEYVGIVGKVVELREYFPDRKYDPSNTRINMCNILVDIEVEWRKEHQLYQHESQIALYENELEPTTKEEWVIYNTTARLTE